MLTVARNILIALACLYASNAASGQDSASAASRVLDFPSKFFKKVNGETTGLDKQLEKQTLKYVQRLQKKEERLKKKLLKQDSARAAALFAGDPQRQYDYFMQKLKSDSAKVFNSMGPEYLPYADSLQGALGFLGKNPQLLNSSKVFPADVQRSLEQLQQLQAKLQDADQLKQ
ncbi:MAG TPA: hypothetical protein VKR32_12285, partial [Puia sp.]|nr:hypothetical protein [Puia sp.]